MSNDEPDRLHAWVEGHVQGVGFRYFVLEKAVDLELKGWVRNTYDGKVEVLAEGERQALEELLGALEIGPHGAYVSQVEHRWEEADGRFRAFSIAGTY